MHSFLLHCFAQYFVRGGGGVAAHSQNVASVKYASADLSLVMGAGGSRDLACFGTLDNAIRDVGNNGGAAASSNEGERGEEMLRPSSCRAAGSLRTHAQALCGYH
jgi:hypothetical protein